MFLSVYGRHVLLGLFQKIQTHFLFIDGGSLGLLPDLGKDAKLPINLYFLNKHILCCAQRSYLASTSFFIKAIKKVHFTKKIISNLIEKFNHYAIFLSQKKNSLKKSLIAQYCHQINI